MFLWIVLAVFILLIATIIIFEIRNERKYQESRQQKKSNHPKPKREEKPTPRRPQIKVEPQTPMTTKVVKETTLVEEPIKKSEPQTPKKTLPECQYPTFKHDRLLEMGLSDDDAKEFVGELISQLDEQTNKIDDAINNSDIHALELITHMIKGSATNLGTGGVSDLLTEFNTYLKEGTDNDIIKKYAHALIEYTTKLKIQYA